VPIRGYGVVDSLETGTIILCRYFNVDDGVMVPVFDGPYFARSSYLASTMVTLEGRWRFTVFHHHPQLSSPMEDGVQFLAFKLGNSRHLFVNFEDNEIPLFQQAIKLVGRLMILPRPPGRFGGLYPRQVGSPPIIANVVITAYFFVLGEETTVVQVPAVLFRVSEGTTIPVIAEKTSSIAIQLSADSYQGKPPRYAVYYGMRAVTPTSPMMALSATPPTVFCYMFRQADVGGAFVNIQDPADRKDADNVIKSFFDIAGV